MHVKLSKPCLLLRPYIASYRNVSRNIVVPGLSLTRTKSVQLLLCPVLRPSLKNSRRLKRLLRLGDPSIVSVFLKRSVTLQVHESELLKEESAKKAAADEAVKVAIAQAVAEAKVHTWLQLTAFTFEIR